MPDALGLFIMPPSEMDLLKRLRARGRDDEEAIQRRFAHAKAEIKLAQSGEIYEHYLTNDDLPTSFVPRTCRPWNSGTRADFDQTCYFV